jgi:hypothetical protein
VAKIVLEAQVGWQVFSEKVPVPLALVVPHTLQVMPVTE